MNRSREGLHLLDCIKIMKNNKLNPSISCSHAYHSTQLTRLERRAQLSKTHALPRKPVIFSLEHYNLHDSSRGASSLASKEGYGVFSLQKIKMERVRQHRNMLDNAKMPSFNIKKMFDHKDRKRKEKGDRLNNTDKRQDSHEKDREDSNDLKNFWNRYLQSQLMTPHITHQIESFNKTMGLIVNRPKQNKSESTKRNSVQLAADSSSSVFQGTPKRADSKDRTTFYVNNFIKTRYRKRHPSSQMEAAKAQQSVKVSFGEDLGQGNWVMPWQKSQDTEEDNFVA